MTNKFTEHVSGCERCMHAGKYELIDQYLCRKGRRLKRMVLPASHTLRCPKCGVIADCRYCGHRLTQPGFATNAQISTQTMVVEAVAKTTFGTSPHSPHISICNCAECIRKQATKPAETPAAVPLFCSRCSVSVNLTGDYLLWRHNDGSLMCEDAEATPAPADTWGAQTYIQEMQQILRDGGMLDPMEGAKIEVDFSLDPDRVGKKLADPGDTPQPQGRPLTQADQKVYDPFADLEFIAKEINGEDIALEDLAAQLEHATQCLREMFAATGKTPDALPCDHKYLPACSNCGKTSAQIADEAFAGLKATLAATLPTREEKK